MALISELLASVIILVTRAFSMLKQACLFPIRIGLVVIYNWTELVRTTIIFNANIVLGIISWTIGLIFLPVRAVNAIQRERQVSSHSMIVFVLSMLHDYLDLQDFVSYNKLYETLTPSRIPDIILKHR